MKYCYSATTRLVVASLVLLAFGPTLWLTADETEIPAFPTLNWGASREEIQVVHGAPAFVADSIFIYPAVVFTVGGAVAADLTLWFRSDRLFFASYAFQISDRSEGDLSAQFESISERLHEAYDEPSSLASEPDSFTTEVWNLDEVDIEHTLILDPDRVDHAVTLTSAQN